jgi:pyrroline-5-carboxylate reductase
MGKDKSVNKNKIGIIGAGKIGEAILIGLLKSPHFIGPSQKLILTATTKSQTSAEDLLKKIKTLLPQNLKNIELKVHNDNIKLTKDSDIIILAVKPQVVKEVLTSIEPYLTKDKILISVCASIDCKTLSKFTKNKPKIIRAMPNTPCLIRQGMTAISAGPSANEESIKIAKKIFDSLGLSIILEESLLDAVTGLSGCGPAYMFLILEALSEAGVKVGLPRKIATLLSAQTMLGSAQMILQRNAHPAELKDEVTTPAGCTIDALMALEDGGIRSTLIKGVLAATKRSIILSKGINKKISKKG